jgi:hypothetical protein
MRLLFIGGSHPRHLYYLNRIAERFDVRAALLQKRGDMFPAVPDGASAHDSDLWVRHFQNRNAKEYEYFGAPTSPEFEHKWTAGSDLSSLHNVVYARSFAPDVVLIFGCGMIREPLLSALPPDTFNLHLGLSPRYRGAAPVFWPQYFLEPQWAGTTMHRIVHEPDAGEILHQSAPDLGRGDTIHDVSCRAVVTAADEAVELLERMAILGHLPTVPQRATGKNFLESDFQPAHLRPIYDVWEDRIVDAYLDGLIGGREPKLRRPAWQPVPV